MARLSTLARALALVAQFTTAASFAIGPRPNGQSAFPPKYVTPGYTGVPLGDIPSNFVTMVPSAQSGSNPAIHSHGPDPEMQPHSIPPFPVPSNVTMGFPASHRSIRPESVPPFSATATGVGFPASRPTQYPRSHPPFPMPNATMTDSFHNANISGQNLCSGSPATYTVVHLDTVGKIAAKLNVTVDALESANVGKVMDWDLIEMGTELEVPRTTCFRSRPTGHVATGPSFPIATLTSMAISTLSPPFGLTPPSTGPAQVTGNLAVTAFDRGAGATTPEVMYSHFMGDGSVTDGWPPTLDWLSWNAQWENVENYIGKRCNTDITPNSDAETQELGTSLLANATSVHLDPRFTLAIMMQASNACVRGPQLDMAKLVSALSDAGTGPNSNMAQAYYHAARMYSSGSDGMSSPEAACYASDIANRLRGWSNGASGRSPCKAD